MTCKFPGIAANCDLRLDCSRRFSKILEDSRRFSEDSGSFLQTQSRARRQPESLDLLCPEDASKVDGKVAQIECLHAGVAGAEAPGRGSNDTIFAIFAGLATATLAAVAALIFLNRKLKQASLETRLVTLQDEKKPEIAEEDEESEEAESQEDEESEVSESESDEESEEAEALEDESPPNPWRMRSPPRPWRMSPKYPNPVSESQEDEESEVSESPPEWRMRSPESQEDEESRIPGG
nr:uncharacterized protein LOC113825259 [Penaeus vannamei]